MTQDTVQALSSLEQGVTERTTCRVCGGTPLRSILSLGDQYVINFLDGASSETGWRAPLDFTLCQNHACGLVQLRHTVPPDFLYRQYWYKSGINQTMRAALANITQEVERRLPLSPSDVVVDIGCNDGTLLRSYQTPGLFTVGFEPAKNLIPEARVGTSLVLNEFFNAAGFTRALPDKQANVVTSIAMFYDLENPNAFVGDVKSLLAKEGIWVIQMNYLLSMLSLNAFDNISHEHLEYYSLSALEALLQRHGLEVFDLELNDMNGGSIRTYIGHRGNHPISPRVSEQRQAEAPLRSLTVYADFAKRVNQAKSQVSEFIRQEVRRGKRVYAYGASTRGNTLLQYFELDETLVTAAAERNPLKYGKRMVGTNIPIISEDQARREAPAYFLVLPWAFIEEFMTRERAFLEAGGQFIVPLPEFRLISRAKNTG